MNPHTNVGHPCDNGRESGGRAGPEHRYSREAVDTDRWDEATKGAEARGKWQGESGQVIGAYANTIGTPRGKIEGATIDGSWPNNGFKK